MMSVGQPLRDIALVEIPASEWASPEKPGSNGISGPQHCVLLRAGGLLSVLDMEQGKSATALRLTLPAFVALLVSMLQSLSRGSQCDGQHEFPLHAMSRG